MKTTSKTCKVRKTGSLPSNLCHFEATYPHAKCVCIAGTFNDWHPHASEMVRVEGGRWIKSIVLPPGNYEYRFVIDGVWEQDPNARGSVPNPYGGKNSIVTVPNPPATAQPVLVLTPSFKSYDFRISSARPRTRAEESQFQRHTCDA